MLLLVIVMSRVMVILICLSIVSSVSYWCCGIGRLCRVRSSVLVMKGVSMGVIMRWVFMVDDVWCCGY